MRHEHNITTQKGEELCHGIGAEFRKGRGNTELGRDVAWLYGEGTYALHLKECVAFRHMEV